MGKLSPYWGFPFVYVQGLEGITSSSLVLAFVHIPFLGGHHEKIIENHPWLEWLVSSVPFWALNYHIQQKKQGVCARYEKDRSSQCNSRNTWEMWSSTAKTSAANIEFLPCSCWAYPSQKCRGCLIQIWLEKWIVAAFGLPFGTAVFFESAKTAKFRRRAVFKSLVDEFGHYGYPMWRFPEMGVPSNHPF